METKSTTTETDKDRERLLAKLTPRERTLVESVMADHPGLTAAEAIQHLKNASM